MSITLKNLAMQNIGIIDDLNVEFGKGLNVVTGETGAGKSLIVNSFNVLLGLKINTDTVVRTGQEEASIEAVLDSREGSMLNDFLESAGISSSDEEEIFVKRLISRSGRGKCWANTDVVSVSVLKEMGSLIADICGSHSHQDLLDPGNHLILLDRFCKNEEVLLNWNEACNRYTDLHKKIEELEDEERLRIEKLMIYQMQKEELKFLKDLRDNEEEIERKHSILSNSEKIHENAQSILFTISEDDGLVTKAKTVSKNLSILADFNDSFENFKKELDSTLATYLELQREVESFTESVEFDNKEMSQIEETLFHIKRLKNKYRLDFEGLKSYFLEIDDKIQMLENIDVAKEDLNGFIKSAKKDVTKWGGDLSKRRRKGAKELEKLIVHELRELSIKNVDFEVRFFVRDSNGIEKVSAEFFIMTNIGEDMKPLSQITSSGEVSRIMLAIKKIFSDVDKIPILIFDEIDSNIGGETAVVVGRKLKSLSKSHQIIVITHMPQIAKYADFHFSVRKKEIKGKTKVYVTMLSEKERISEIARMMGGERITSVVERHAKELIKGGGSK